MKKVFALVAVAAILVVGTACGVAQESYDAVIAERDSAQAELQSVKGELQSAKSELDTITSITLPKEAIKLSEVVPTMGEHWANPTTLPVGPVYLVHDEEVIGVEYLFTADLMEEVTMAGPEGEVTFKQLPGLPVGAVVNHMDIEFQPEGIPGFEEPIYSVHLYFISAEERQELVPHGH